MNKIRKFEQKALRRTGTKKGRHLTEAKMNMISSYQRKNKEFLTCIFQIFLLYIKESVIKKIFTVNQNNRIFEPKNK